MIHSNADQDDDVVYDLMANSTGMSASNYGERIVKKWDAKHNFTGIHVLVEGELQTMLVFVPLTYLQTMRPKLWIC